MNAAVSLAEEALAAARITQLLTEDAIPLVARPRNYLVQRYSRTSFAYLLTCPHCVGVWAAGFGMVAGWLAPEAWGRVRRGLAVAYVAGHAVHRLPVH